jgi:3-methylfumaryl-CoA hydratase
MQIVQSYRSAHTQFNYKKKGPDVSDSNMISDELDMALLQQWVGKTETSEDLMSPTSAAALSATLDHGAPLRAGAALPPLWHWIYFWSVAAQSELGPDGHPTRGKFLPPVPLPRRMWAGGRLRFTAPLVTGSAATRNSRIASVTKKSGPRGSLAFVTVRHEIVQDGVLTLTEEHDIVYRAAPQPGAVAPSPKPAPLASAWSRTVCPDPVLLFRYSALTFNGHRIHYDRHHSTKVEGYPGLIVHGPLIATLLVDLLLEKMPQARLSTFDFRAISPLFDIEPFTICGQPSVDGSSVRLWAKNGRGELAMEADATLDLAPTFTKLSQETLDD